MYSTTKPNDDNYATMSRPEIHYIKLYPNSGSSGNRYWQYEAYGCMAMTMLMLEVGGGTGGRGSAGGVW